MVRPWTWALTTHLVMMVRAVPAEWEVPALTVLVVIRKVREAGPVAWAALEVLAVLGAVEQMRGVRRRLWFALGSR